MKKLDNKQDNVQVETKKETSNFHVAEKYHSYYDNLTTEALTYKDAMMRCCCDC